MKYLFFFLVLYIATNNSPAWSAICEEKMSNASAHKKLRLLVIELKKNNVEIEDYPSEIYFENCLLINKISELGVNSQDKFTFLHVVSTQLDPSDEKERNSQIEAINSSLTKIHPSWEFGNIPDAHKNKSFAKFKDIFDLNSFFTKNQLNEPEIQQSWCDFGKKKRATIFSVFASNDYFVTHRPGGHPNYLETLKLWQLEQNCTDPVTLSIDSAWDRKICKQNMVDADSNIKVICTFQ